MFFLMKAGQKLYFEEIIAIFSSKKLRKFKSFVIALFDVSLFLSDSLRTSMQRFFTFKEFRTEIWHFEIGRFRALWQKQRVTLETSVSKLIVSMTEFLSFHFQTN